VEIFNGRIGQSSRIEFTSTAFEVMRYIRYRRKSSEREERQVLSNKSQKIELDKKFSNLEIVNDFEESKSAFHPDIRPDFSTMIEILKNGEADGIIAWHPDRLSRNEIDAATITYMVRTGVIKDLKFGSYYFDNSPEGIMMIQNALSHSQYSSSKLSVDTKRGLRTKAEIGWYSGVAKFGYLNNKSKDKGEKDIYPDPDRFKIARRMWDLMLTGLYSPPQILKIANEDWGVRTVKRRRSGGNPLSRSFIYNFFTDPFYYGEFKWLDKDEIRVWHKGKHEPMITKEEYDRVQILLGRKGRPRPQTHQFAYTGLMRCGGCGAAVTADEKWQIICSSCKFKFSSNNKDSCPNCNTIIEEMKNPKILHYIYYKCTKRKDPNCTQRSVEVNELEKQVDDYVLKIGIPERFKEWGLKRLNEDNDREIEGRTVTYKSLQKAHNEAQAGLDELTKMRYRQLIDDEQFQRQQKELKKEVRDLKDKLNDTEHRAERWFDTTERTFNFARNARYWFEHGTQEDKRIILDGLGSNILLKDKEVKIELEKPLLKIEKGLAEMQKKGLFEPRKEIDLSANKDLLTAQKTEWLPG